MSGTLVSYAAGSDKAEAFNRVRIQNPNIVFSDFYAVGNRTDGGHDYVFVDSAVYPSDSFFCIVEDITYVNGNQGIRGRAAYISSDGTVFYISGAFTRNIVQNSNGSWGSYTVCMDVLYNTCYGSVDIADTNIPIFLSEEGAKAFYLDGDISGVKNPDSWDLYSYDSSVESPRDLRVDMDIEFREHLGSSVGNAPQDVDTGNAHCKFSWNQSDEALKSAEEQGLMYKTEIYFQTTIIRYEDPFCLIKGSEALSPSEIICVKNVTSQANSYTFSYEDIQEVYKKWRSDGVFKSWSNEWATPVISNFPCYFYVRNCVGTRCGNWIRVSVTDGKNGGIQISNSLVGTNTVVSGYDEIKGDTPLPGFDSSMKGEPVQDSQYGADYKIDIDSKSVENLVGNVKNGFGILGSDGLVAFFEQCFSFLPSEYFSILVTFVSAAAVIALFKLLF